MVNLTASHAGPDTASTTAIDGDFDALIAAVQRRFTALVADKHGAAPLFLTDHLDTPGTPGTPDLYDAFVAALPAALRPIYACAACRGFVRRFGGIVRVTPKGATESALWDPTQVAEPYVAAVAALADLVTRAPITGLFLATEAVWGRPRTGAWTHLAVTPPESLVFKPSPTRSQHQLVAEKLADHANLLRALEQFPLPLVVNAHTLLTTGSLYRAEKCIGPAQWLIDLHDRRAALRSARARDNITWLAVASAPAGFCHLQSSMLGTLLTDLAAGLPFESVRDRFAAKMHPLQYQRPTAAPTAGNIAQAEKIIEALRAAGALERRFATLADIEPLWSPTPQPEPDPPSGVFSHLKPKPSSPAAVEAPPVTITWDKFSRTVLPTAQTLEYWVPTDKQPYLGLVTASNLEAPPIIQWDRDTRRNPVTWYVYHGGSLPAQWNLEGGAYHPVTAVTLAPWMWSQPELSSHHGEKVVLILAGARDTTYTCGAGFFPEFLKSEYHPVRATLEAYARTAVVAGKDQASACGIVLQKGSTWNYRVRVTSRAGVRVAYILDRWD